MLIIIITLISEQHVAVVVHVCMIYPVVTIMKHPQQYVSKFIFISLFSIFHRRYNNRYNYSNEHYQQHQTRSLNKTTKRGGSSSATATDRHQTKPATISGSTTNLRHQSASDNEQKEGEEWETASESSANMRNVHHDTQQQPLVKSATNENKIN